MLDTEFHFGESLLFSNAPEAEPTNLEAAANHENVPFMETETEVPQPAPEPSLSTENSAPNSLNITPETSEITSEITSNTEPQAKEVKLFNGTTITLRARRRKPVAVETNFGTESDSLLNMDELHERVQKQEQLRKTQSQILQLKQQKPAPQKADPGSHQMWSEKYKPRTFMDICPAGNERSYRLIMQWLRKWGKVVFGAPKDDGESVDALGRPLRKVLLVHGPPGMGKTAVVHLLARQMGYSVEELNAANSMNALPQSDATDGAGRFASASAALKLKVKNALTTTSITSKGRPTCLVIDEIDSAINAGDIVKVVSDLVRTDHASMRARAQNGNNGKNTKSTKKPFFLNRPIICIANDIYTSSVRTFGPNPMESLRPLCEIVAFRKHGSGAMPMPGTRLNLSAEKSVKEFLKEISDKENLSLDRKQIAEVYEVCEGDIRACINHLQFACRKFDADMHRFARSAGSGNNANVNGYTNKDSQVTWFALVERIFQRDQNASKEDSFQAMLEMVSAGSGRAAASGSGALEKVVRGCFNKYLDVVHMQDDSIVRPAEIADWLYYYDLLSTQNLSSEFYPALSALKFWSLFSDINPQKFRDMPSLVPDARSLDFTTREAIKRNRDVLRRLSDSVVAHTKGSVCSASPYGAFYACEFAPLLDRMLSPELGAAKSKAANSEHEMGVVRKIARLVKSFDIQLESQRDVETGQTYLLYGPDWEGVTMFAGASGEQTLDQRKRVLNSKRQWLFPLVQAELDSLLSATSLKRQAVAAGVEEKTDAKSKRAHVASSLDFFKGKYDDMSSKIATPSAPRPLNKEATRIWVKHHEGFSNAVRKNIGWHELWN